MLSVDHAAPTYGRFNTPDLVGGGAKEPGSWNMYSYSRGDPVNRTDHSGLCDSDFCVDAWGSSWSWGDPLAGLWDMAGPDFDPSALAECLAVPGCEDAYQLSMGGGGGVATTLGSSGALSYSVALGAWQSAQKWVANTTLKPGCDSLEQALGINSAAWQSAAGAEQFFNGLAAAGVLMTSLFAGAAVPGMYDNAVQQFGDESVADFLNSRDNGPGPGAAAVSYLGHPLVFLDYKDINPSNFYVNASNVLHEALHNLLGLTDQGLQLILNRAGFNIQVSSDSSNISTLIAQKCF